MMLTSFRLAALDMGLRRSFALPQCLIGQF